MRSIKSPSKTLFQKNNHHIKSSLMQTCIIHTYTHKPGEKETDAFTNDRVYPSSPIYIYVLYLYRPLKSRKFECLLTGSFFTWTRALAMHLLSSPPLSLFLSSFGENVGIGGDHEENSLYSCDTKLRVDHFLSADAPARYLRFLIEPRGAAQ